MHRLHSDATMLLALLLAVTAAPPVPKPGPPVPAALSDIPDLKMTWYEVTGADPRSIRRSINERRPSDPRTGEKFDGRTDTTYSWTGRGRPGGCDVTFTRTVEITLPRLAAPERLSAAERAEWTRYMTALIAHERNHALIALKGMTAIDERLRAGLCSEGAAATKPLQDAIAAAQVEYDRRTEHGKLEGAVYPSGAPVSRRSRGR